MNNSTAKLDLEGLRELVRSTSITVAHTDTDSRVFTVYSESEPLFCYDANSIGEVQSLVVDTFRSYAKNFHDVEDFTIDFRVAGADPETGLPIERIVSSKPLEAVFDKAA